MDKLSEPIELTKVPSIVVYSPFTKIRSICLSDYWCCLRLQRNMLKQYVLRELIQLIDLHAVVVGTALCMCMDTRVIWEMTNSRPTIHVSQWCR